MPAVNNVGMTLRRLKTYAGTQGYVYQYYFVGQRAARQCAICAVYVTPRLHCGLMDFTTIASGSWVTSEN